MRRLLPLVATLVALPASAIPVSYEFEGTLNFVSRGDFQELVIPLAITEGDTFRGLFTYDTDLSTDTNPSPNLGTYNALQSVMLDVGQYRFDVGSPVPTIFDVNFSDNRNDQFDGFAFRASGGFPGPVAVEPGQEWTLNLVLRSNDLTLVDSDELSAELGPIDRYDRLASFAIVLFDQLGQAGQASGAVTALRRVSVSEPSTALLLIAALLATAVCVRRTARGSS